MNFICFNRKNCFAILIAVLMFVPLPMTNGAASAAQIAVGISKTQPEKSATGPVPSNSNSSPPSFTSSPNLSENPSEPRDPVIPIPTDPNPPSGPGDGGGGSQPSVPPQGPGNGSEAGGNSGGQNPSGPGDGGSEGENPGGLGDGEQDPSNPDDVNETGTSGSGSQKICILILRRVGDECFDGCGDPVDCTTGAKKSGGSGSSGASGSNKGAAGGPKSPASGGSGKSSFSASSSDASSFSAEGDGQTGNISETDWGSGIMDPVSAAENISPYYGRKHTGRINYRSSWPVSNGSVSGIHYRPPRRSPTSNGSVSRLYDPKVQEILRRMAERRERDALRREGQVTMKQLQYNDTYSKKKVKEWEEEARELRRREAKRRERMRQKWACQTTPGCDISSMPS